MSCKGLKAIEVVNNEEFEIVEILDDAVHMMGRDDKPVVVAVSEFNQKYVVAYAMTVHKSQGKTFDFPYAIWQSNALDKHLLYTALTRTSSRYNVVLAHNSWLPRFFSLQEVPFTDKFLRGKLSGYKKQDEENGLVNRNRAADLFDVQELIKRECNSCFNCGNTLDTSSHALSHETHFTLDRLNNSYGHLKGNLQLSCWRCNRDKPAST